MQNYTHITHTFEPVFDNHSKILILGSLPSVRSREQGFYYGHPRNRFWKVISTLAKKSEPESINEKKQLLLDSHIAIWDVVQQCDIIGSSDASIRNVIPTELNRVFENCEINAVFANGSTAAKLYGKYQRLITNKDIITLPSTSPANAAWSLQRLIEAWQCVLKYLK